MWRAVLGRLWVQPSDRRPLAINAARQITTPRTMLFQSAAGKFANPNTNGEAISQIPKTAFTMLGA
jgi:hypothetical protein